MNYIRTFYILIKIKDKIVADGLDDSSFDVTDTGKHLSANEFNQAMKAPNTIVVDMRNQYESEVGHFQGAICPDADTFREELPMVKDQLKGKEDKKILLYCTGGIRCEKASAYLKHNGFKDTNQLHGGIIEYKNEIEKKGIKLSLSRAEEADLKLVVVDAKNLNFTDVLKGLLAVSYTHLTLPTNREV